MEKLGIIGGSGLDDPNILANPYDESVSTPYGAPSSPLKHGTIAGHEVVLATMITFSPCYQSHGLMSIKSVLVTQMICELSIFQKGHLGVSFV